MKRTLSILLLSMVTQTGISQHTILWKVTDTTTHKTSFIVGSFHQFGNSFVDSMPEIGESLRRSELAIFESIGKSEEVKKIIEEREASSQIENWIKKEDLVKLKQLTKDWNVDLYKLKPIELKWKLQQEFQKIRCKTIVPIDEFDHFDNYLQHLAEQSGIELLGLETDSSQLSLIEKENSAATWKTERKEIGFWIEQMTADEPNMSYCYLADKYRKLELDYEFGNECEHNVLVYQRNMDWMKVLPGLLQSTNAFVVVGYFHLKWKCGLLMQLEQAGFIVDPVAL